MIEHEIKNIYFSLAECARTDISLMGTTHPAGNKQIILMSPSFCGDVGSHIISNVSFQIWICRGIQMMNCEIALGICVGISETEEFFFPPVRCAFESHRGVWGLSAVGSTVFQSLDIMLH